MPDSTEARKPGRREALKKIARGAATVTTLPIIGQISVTPAMARAALHHGFESSSETPEADWKPLFFDKHQNDIVVALTELIIPQTGTPGAKAAQVNRFIDLMLNEEAADRQKRFLEGLAWIDARSLKLYGKPLTQATMEQQTALLTPLADPANKNPEDRPGVAFFESLKDMTIFGYYTSKIGMEQELEYGGDDYHTEFPGACTHPEHQS